MIDSIFVAESGLRSFGQGLRTISNNTANLNTPGYKGSTLQFADMFYGSDGLNSGTQGLNNQSGYGVQALGSSLNFSQGQLQNTGNSLDLALNGQGFFTLKDSAGTILYTQDGQFKFNSDGVLVSVSTGDQVMAVDANGVMGPVSLNGLGESASKATSSISFSGNLSSTATTASVSGLNVIDTNGVSHALTLALTPVSGSPGSWTVTLQDGTTSVGTATLAFSNGQPSGGGKLTVNYTPNGGTVVPLTLDFSANVTSFDMGTSSTLAVAKQDGYVAGALTGKTVDSTGTVVMTYANGQTVKGKQLALGQYLSPDDVEAMGTNTYSAKNGSHWQTGVAGSGIFGTVQSGVIEMSNVDLSKEFSNLVIMQRGYQACSQVVSTASEMLTALYGMITK